MRGGTPSSRAVSLPLKQTCIWIPALAVGNPERMAANRSGSSKLKG